MSGYFTGLNQDNLFVESKKDENINYNNLRHLEPVVDHYGSERLVYNHSDYDLNTALSIILHFVESNNHLFFDYKLLISTLKNFFLIYTNVMHNQSFDISEQDNKTSQEEFKKSFNSIMFIQHSTPVNGEQRKIKNLMNNTLKSLLTISCEEKEPLELDNYHWKTSDEDERRTLDFNKAELFLEGEYHLKFEIETLNR